MSPQLFQALTRLNQTPGALEAVLSAEDESQLPPDIAEVLRKTEADLQATTGGAWKVADVDFVRESIKDIAPYILKLEQTVKEKLGAVEAAIVATVAPMGIYGLGAATAWTGLRFLQPNFLQRNVQPDIDRQLKEAPSDELKMKLLMEEKRKVLMHGQSPGNPLHLFDLPGRPATMPEGRLMEERRTALNPTPLPDAAPDDDAKMQLLKQRQREAFAQGQLPDAAGNPPPLFDLPGKTIGIVEGRLIENMSASEALGYEMRKNREAVEELTKALNGYLPRQREANNTSNRPRGPTR